MVDIHNLPSHRMLSVVALVGIVLGIVATLWWAFLFFLVGPDPLAIETPSAASKQSPSDIPIDRLVALHLFGKPGGDAAPRTENLRETKLSLVLHGVFVADDAEASTAVVSQRNNNPRLYAIAERLPGDARLEEVHRDRVVISRGGVRENLSFERDDPIARPVMAARQANAGRPQSAPRTEQRTFQVERNARSLIERTLAKHREGIDRDPRRFIESLGLTASARGGYLLGTFADNNAGLERNDRLLSLNGNPVGNPEEDRRQLERILAGRAVNIQIQRGEQLIRFNLSLD